MSSVNPGPGLIPVVTPPGVVVNAEGVPADGDVPTYAAATQSVSWKAGGGGSQPGVTKYIFTFADFTSIFGGGYALLPIIPAGRWVELLDILVTTAFDDSDAAQHLLFVTAAVSVGATSYDANSLPVSQGDGLYGPAADLIGGTASLPVYTTADTQFYIGAATWASDGTKGTVEVHVRVSEAQAP